MKRKCQRRKKFLILIISLFYLFLSVIIFLFHKLFCKLKLNSFIKKRSAIRVLLLHHEIFTNILFAFFTQLAFRLQKFGFNKKFTINSKSDLSFFSRTFCLFYFLHFKMCWSIFEVKIFHLLVNIMENFNLSFSTNGNVSENVVLLNLHILECKRL